MSSVEKLETMLLMKFSRMMTARMAFQSVAFSPSSRHIDSRATFTIAGGFPIERTSTKCCFLIDLTAVQCNGGVGRRVCVAAATSAKREDSTKKRETKAVSEVASPSARPRMLSVVSHIVISVPYVDAVLITYKRYIALFNISY